MPDPIAYAWTLLQLEPAPQPAPRGTRPLKVRDLEPADVRAVIASLRWRIRGWARALPAMRHALDAARRAFRIQPDLSHARALTAAWVDVGAVLTVLEEAPQYAADLRADVELTGLKRDADE